MGQISRIQLRGISRNPSDRLNEDGGCAESLNVYLDQGESAPALKPMDVTSDLGLPDDLKADRIFIHKTQTRDLYIAVDGKSIVWCKTPKPEVILSLKDDEEVQNITSFGNTLGVLTSQYTYWLLYKEGEYSLLGTKVPFPKFKIANYEVAGRALEDEESDEKVVRSFSFGNGSTTEPVRKLSFDALSESYNKNKEIDDEDSLSLIKDLWSKYAEVETLNREQGVFNHQVHAILSVKLMDESEIISAPIVLSAGYDQPLEVDYKHLKSEIYEAGGDGEGSYSNHWYEYETRLTCKLKGAYKIFLKLDEAASLFDSWTDVVDCVNLYVSSRVATDIPKDCALAVDPRMDVTEDSNIDEETGNGYRYIDEVTTAKLRLGNSEYSYEDRHLGACVFRLFKSFTLQEMEMLTNGMVVEVEKEKMSEDDIEGLLDFSKASMVNYDVAFKEGASFNGRLVAYGVKETKEVQVTNLNAVNYTNKALTDEFIAPRPEEFTRDGLQQYYSLTYYYKDNDGNESKLTAKLPVEHPYESELNYIRMGDGIKIGDIDAYANAFQFIICPDSRAYKVDVKFDYYTADGDTVKSEGIGHFDLKPHPFIPSCTYYYGGMEQNLANACLDTDNEYIVGPTSITEDRPNKVYVSEQDSPFVFPVKSRYTFQSKVIGVAVATTALSQGQFGQFPLYVFTEDGIWAMETAADGSFLTSKPLSRDVCINADSITSIDSAVVFVSDKGVMLLQGSQTVNLSPNMTGRHYRLEDSAKVIMQGQADFSGLLPVVSDDTHFQAFMRNATIAYDYPGKRLVCINRSEEYQYIYMLDTQTWHKTAYGIKVETPLNSYPEAYVQGKGEAYSLILYVEDAYRYDDQTFDLFLGEAQGLVPLTEAELRDMFFNGKNYVVVVDDAGKAAIDKASQMADEHAKVTLSYEESKVEVTRIYDFSTILDRQETMTPTKGIIVTRALDLGEPDVLKTITDVRVRGDFRKGAVKFILLGSQDGMAYHPLSTLRGRAWKEFRIVLLADLQPNERISWIDVMYETRFTNKLR